MAPPYVRFRGLSGRYTTSGPRKDRPTYRDKDLGFQDPRRLSLGSP